MAAPPARIRSMRSAGPLSPQLLRRATGLCGRMLLDAGGGATTLAPFPSLLRAAMLSGDRRRPGPDGPLSHAVLAACCWIHYADATLSNLPA